MYLKTFVGFEAGGRPSQSDGSPKLRRPPPNRAGAPSKSLAKRSPLSSRFAVFWTTCAATEMRRFVDKPASWTESMQTILKSLGGK